MPLRVATEPIEPQSLTEVPEEYLIFYSSLTEGKLWCPDCARVDTLIQETFNPNGGPTALIVYVGQKAEWKAPSNKFRGPPWNIDSIPTIVKLRNSKEDGRLVEDEILKNLSSFIGG